MAPDHRGSLEPAPVLARGASSLQTEHLLKDSGAAVPFRSDGALWQNVRRPWRLSVSPVHQDHAILHHPAHFFDDNRDVRQGIAFDGN